MKKVKRIVLILIALVLLAGLFGCGRSGSDDQAAEDEAVTTEDYNEDAEAAEAENSEAADSEAEEESDDGLSVISPEFKKTMDDYEAWFDHYCEVMKKYQDNPSDLEIMTEMTELMAEEATMLDQMESMDESEMNNAELAYYLEVTARIEKKLLEVADY